MLVLFLASDDMTVRKWDVERGRELFVVNIEPGSCVEGLFLCCNDSLIVVITQIEDSHSLITISLK